MYCYLNQKRISFLDSGNKNAPCLVLLHGFMENKEHWQPIIHKLTPQFRVVAIDLAGHGETESFPPTHDMSTMAQIVHVVLEELCIQKVLVVGHSLGGYVALAFANTYTSMCNGIVLFHSNANADSPDAIQNRNRYIQLIEQKKKHLLFITPFFNELFFADNVSHFKKEIEIMKNEALQFSDEAIIYTLQGMRDRECRQDFLQTSPFPILFIIGRQDKFISMPQLFEQLQWCNHSELLLLNSCGHMGILEKQEETTSALIHFALRCFAE